MDVSNISHDGIPAFITVRNHPNRIVNFPSNKEPKKSDGDAGFWTVKPFNFVPKEYQELANKL